MSVKVYARIRSFIVTCVLFGFFWPNSSIVILELPNCLVRQEYNGNVTIGPHFCMNLQNNCKNIMSYIVILISFKSISSINYG